MKTQWFFNYSTLNFAKNIVFTTLNKVCLDLGRFFFFFVIVWKVSGWGGHPLAGWSDRHPSVPVSWPVSHPNSPAG